MKKFISYLTRLCSPSVGSQKDESSTRLRVDYDSFTCRLRVWHVLCSRMAAVFLLLLTLSIGNAWGDSYTITFNGTNSESTSISTSTTAASITGSSTYVTGNVAAATKAYGATSSGIKLGTSSASGSIKINLSASGQVTPTSIVVNAKLYSSSKAATLSVNGSSAQSLTSSYANYTFSITSAITYIQLNASKYAWIKSVTVNYGEGGGGGSSCNAIDVTGGSSVILPKGSTTVAAYDWKNAGAPTAYAAVDEYTIGSGEYCVSLTQAGDYGNANGLQLKASSGVVEITGIKSTSGIDVEISCSGTNGFKVELTGATTLTGQTGTVSISTTSTSAALKISKNTSSAGYIKYIKVSPKAAVATYTVSYANGGGSGTNPGSHTGITSGSSITLKANTFTAPAGKQFAGWNDGTSTYAAGASYTVTANKTMTAQWSCITPTISTHPSNGSCSQGGSPTPLTVVASGGTLTYQWKQCATSGGTYTNVSAGSGGTTASYTPPTTTIGTTYYKCVVTNTGSSCNTTATSNYASFEVLAPTPATITLENYDGDAVTTGYYVGDSYQLPSTNDFVCGEKDFVGWSSVTIDNSTNKPTAATYYEPGAYATLVASNTFYAVFAEDPGEIYELVTSSSDALAAGDEIIITNSGATGSAKALGAQNLNNKGDTQTNRKAIDVTIKTVSGKTVIESPTLASGTDNTTNIYPLVLEANNGAFAIKENMTSGRYLAATGTNSNNYLATVASVNTTTAKFTISVDAEGVASIDAESVTRGELKFNNSSTLFACYSSGQDDVYIFRKSGPQNYSTTCESCNVVTLSIGSITNATMTVKKGAKTLTNGNTVATCSEQTIDVKITPDENYRLKTLSISGVDDIEILPDIASSLPCPREITFSVTIPEDGEGTLIITPTTEATPQATVTFLANGDEVDTETVYEGFQTPLPTAPADNTLACAEEFVGWSKNEITETGNVKPGDLFVKPSAAPIITEATTFHAVFATVDGSTTMTKQDLLNQALTGVTSSTTYEEVTDLSVIGGSHAVYTVQCAGDHSSIQLRSNNNNSGIVTTTSGGTAKKVTVVWESHTGDGRTIDIYGKTTAYSAATDLYGGNAGDLLGSIVKGTSTELEIDDEDEYTYIGIRSNDGALYLTSVTIDWEGPGCKDYMTYCTNTFTAATNSNWGTTTNWSRGSVPTFKERAEIQKPVVVNVADAKAKNVVLDQSSSNTGSLEVAAGKELVVVETVFKKNSSGELVSTTENDIVISSSSTLALGALVMGTHDGTNKATVNFYTKSTGKKKENTSVGQYVGTPFNDETNILYNWYNSWVYSIYYPNGNIDWERVEEGNGMTPFKGYCVFSRDAWDSGSGHSYWQQGTLVSSDNKTCSSLNYQSGTYTNPNNENLLANSWMAPIKIKAMQSSDFTNTYATVYIFNSTSNSAYTSLAGNYTAHTVGTSEGVIPAMQSFSVFTTGSGASVSLDYNKIVYAPAVAGTASPAVNSAPSRSGRSADEADKMRLFVRSENGCGDMLYMWERADFSEGFENGWDGHKLYGESYAPQLYAITPDGFMAVNCVPDWEGTVVGFRAGTEDNLYTFSFEYEGEGTWYLNDLKTEQSTRILSGNTYAFSTADEDMEARFIISATPLGEVPTGVEMSDIRDQKSDVRKLLIGGTLYIIRNGRMYDATGMMIR